jgi:type III restriction enzyme
LSIANFDQETFDRRPVYFLNTGKLGKDKLLVTKGDKRQFTIWETIRNTEEQLGDKFYLIIDEAHRGMSRTARQENEVATIIQQFVSGKEGVIEPVGLILGVSATPEKFDRHIKETELATGRTARQVAIKPDDVRNSGLLKDQIILFHPDASQPSDWTLLAAAAQRWKLMSEAWAKYAGTQHNVPRVQPAMIVQVENGPPEQFLALAISTLETEVGQIRDEELAHAFQEDTEIKAGHHRIRKIDASSIQDETAVKFVFFKMALTTGWDCPRAEVMMSFRKANDHTLIAQLIGRMIRTPLARRVEEHEVLNTVALYLPHFDKEGVQSVVDRLKNDPDTVPPTDVETDGNSLVTLTRRTDAAADAFKALRTVPTYRVERVRKQSNTRRLMKLSRLLTSLHAVDMDALDDTKALIVGTLKSEMDRLRKEDPAFDKRLSGCDEITVNAVIVEQGTWKDLGGKPERVPLNTNNVDDLFHRAGLRLGEGLEMEYWQTHGDLEDPQRAKLEVFYITQDARAWDTLEKVCGERINALFLKNKSAITALTSAEREQYNKVRELAKEPEALEFSAPAEIVVAIGKEGFAAYDKHLFLDPEGAYRADLNAWERATIEAEIARTDVVGWLRNYDRKPWALSLPYDDGATVLPMFPDFLAVRREGSAMMVDILEPHRPDLDDNWKKARGLAKYAKKHHMELGRVELIRVKGGQLQRLNFALPAVHEKALEWITSNGHLDQLFDEMATNS